MMDNSPEPVKRPTESAVALPTEVVYRNVEPRPEYDQPELENSLIEYWHVIVRHKGTVLLLGILGLVAGYLSTVSDTPIYRAQTSLEVQGLNNDFLNMRDVNPTSANFSVDPTSDILTQVQLLQGGSLREKTIARLHREGVAKAAPSFGATRVGAWMKALHLGSSEPVTWESALEMAAGTLTVRASGTTRIIDISSDSTDPAVAAAFANGLVKEFIDQDMQSRLSSTEQTSDWLVRQLNDLKIKLENSEDQLQAYANSTGLQMTSGTGKDNVRENVADEKLRQLQTEMLAAQAERVKAQSKYELVSGASLDSLPQVIDDTVLRDYQSKLAELRRQYAELTTTLTPQNPKVKKIQAQIDELEAIRLKERGDIVRKIQNEFKAAERRESLISADYNRQLELVSQQASKAIHYDILKREVDTNQQIYESILQKVKEAGVASALKASSYRILDPAKPPSGPFKPAPMRSAALGSLAGLIAGVVFVFVRERGDRSLQQPGDIALYLNLPELGVIPSDRAANMTRLYGGLAGGSKSQGPTGEDLALTTSRRTPGLMSESFHATLTSIMFSGQNGMRPKVIVMTSSNPSEGKTTVTTNLAAALADINQRVLLIDADMRRPRLHKLFNLANDQGLSTLLAQYSRVMKRPKPPMISETDVRNLTVMTSGPIVTNASNLLHSPRLEELLHEVRDEFDVVLIDTPPMLQLADARIIAQHSDAVILVVRAGKTTRDAARAACQKLRQDGTPILGTILNDWVPGQNGYGYDSNYYQAHSKYYTAKKS